MKHEIFVVDNGSSDQTVAILQALQAQNPECIYPVYLDHNTGTTYSRNLALRRARGRHICVMDCDVEVSPGAIAQLVKRIETNPRIGLAAPKLIYSNGNLQRSTDVFPTITTKILRYLFLKSLEKRDAKRSKMGKPPQTSFHEVDYAISAMWVFRRELLDRVGLLDERIRYSPEDVDYCLRIWESGYAIAYDSAVACIHHAQEISRGRRINRVTIQHILGLCYYFKKHGYLIRRPKIQDRINH